MNTVDQLFALKQIVALGSNYYDDATGQHMHRIPSFMAASTLDELEKAGRMVNTFEQFDHDKAVAELKTLSAEWTLQEAASAFAASLWSAPWIWRSALTGKALGYAMPIHAYELFSEPTASENICGICGFHQGSTEDKTLAWYFGMTQGVPIDGHVPEHVILLREMRQLRLSSGVPIPTKYDLWTLSAIFDVLRKLPPRTRYSRAAQILKKARLLPSNNDYAYQSLLEALAIVGILATPEYPGMLTKFTNYRDRDTRPNIRVEVQAPLAWWDSSCGIQQDVFDAVFGHLHLSVVDATGKRPTPEPALAETLTGAFERRRTSKHVFTKTSLEAGSGPAQAGDVYAIRVQEGTWVTVYCHEGSTAKNKSGIARVRCEYLAGVFRNIPSANDLILRYQGSRKGRWQMWTSALDRTPWVRRIARNVPAPAEDQPKPDKVPDGSARELRHLAHWCFNFDD